MTTQEKVDKIEEFFWTNYFYLLIGDDSVINKQGSNIPYQSIIFNKGKHILCDVGDGTINLAYLWTLLWLKEKLEETSPITLNNTLDVYFRLNNKAIEVFEDNWYATQIIEHGFFLRDDIPSGDNIKSNLGMIENSAFEDPCHSPFVSQDQVWNMNPILARLHEEGNIQAGIIGYNINRYIQKNGYTIYNPYLSRLVHFYKYLPTFNENKVKPWDRQTDREEHYKPTIKVKRGANNWYYSGGTKAAVKFFSNTSPTGGLKFNSVREVIYKGIVFILDKVYEPVYRVFTSSDFKHNSYYCYAATSGIWYNKRFKRRFVNKLNKSIKTVRNGEYFEWNIAPLIHGISADVDVDSLSYLLTNAIDEYVEVIDSIDSTTNNINVPSPIWILVSWYWYQALIEAKIS